MSYPATPAIRRLICRLSLDESGCWLWPGATVGNGYGRIWDGDQGRLRPCHQVTYEHFFGPVPHGLQLDHLCRVPRCCNPWHLEPVTSRENSLRGNSPNAQNARKTHCKRGHEFTPENTIARVRGSSVHRSCRTCQNEWARRNRWRWPKRVAA